MTTNIYNAAEKILNHFKDKGWYCETAFDEASLKSEISNYIFEAMTTNLKLNDTNLNNTKTGSKSTTKTYSF